MSVSEVRKPRFELNQSVWVCDRDGRVHWCRVWGIEDGRQVSRQRGGYDGWLYWVRVYAPDGNGFDLSGIKENQLEGPDGQAMRCG